jgi:uncharacterized Zn-binding protein involved in type VI secretion
MSVGHFICQGDKTSCGGEVLDGDQRTHIHGRLRAREGDSVTCGKDGRTYKIIGGISFMNSNGRLIAGTLDSYSGCLCKAELIPSVLLGKYHGRGGSVVSANRLAAETVQTAAHREAPSQRTSTSPSDSHRSAFAAFKPFSGEDPGFYIVPKSVTREALEATLFPIRDPAVMRKFRALNPSTVNVKAGSLIVLSDPNNTSCTYQEAQLMQAAQQVYASLDSLTPQEADFLHRHGAEIASFIGHTSTWLGVSAVVMEKHLANLHDTLQAIERLHQEQYRQHGHLKSPQFFADRQRLLAQLDAHLLNSTRLRGQTTLGDHPKLKTALGISSRSLVHHWDKAGGPGQIPGYSAHVEAVSRATKYMKAGGYLAVGVGGASSLLAIQQVCSSDSEAACEKIKFTEGGKFGLSTAFGIAGGGLASSVGSSMCLAIGASTGGIGGVICVAAIVGTSAWVGTTVGGMGGEYIGEKIYEAVQP